jgi:hypothetical protein
MEQIVPCRNQISDRFPVASFVVRLPPTRYFEVACATDPRLFHTAYQRQRSPNNFFTSRDSGLLRTSRGDTAWMVPPEQLHRFAGARQLYYALATYGNASGADPHFSIAPTALDQVPSISIAADFTGRTLNRARIVSAAPRESTYGGGGERADLTWGGDAALEAQERQTRITDGTDRYDDGQDPSLWEASQAYDPPADATGDPDAGADASGLADALAAGRQDDIAGECDDVPADLQTSAQAAALRDQSNVAARDGDASTGWPAIPPEYATQGATALDAAALSDEHPDFKREGASEADEDEAYGGYEDAAALYGAVNGNGFRYGQVAVADGAAATLAVPPAAEPFGRDPEYREEEFVEDTPTPAEARTLAVVALDIPEKVRVLRVVALAESGRDGYSAINPDREYNTPGHPAYQKYHIGLSWGFIQFTQRSGALGQVLHAARQREERLPASSPPEQRLQAVFGPHWEELIRITNARQPDSRVANIGAAPLWDRSWTERFRTAGRIPYIIAAQNEVAVTQYVDPIVPIAKWLDFNTARAVAMLVDRVIHMGLGGGLSWVLASCGPLKTEAQRDTALHAVGASTLSAFQESCGPILKADGRWGAKTHAALIGALRNLGDRSPIVPPGRDVMLRQLVDGAAGRPFERRLRALFDNHTDFDDGNLYHLA